MHNALIVNPIYSNPSDSPILEHFLELERLETEETKANFLTPHISQSR